jgi:uncharacterized membrane protein YhaH (DUF805 family)
MQNYGRIHPACNSGDKGKGIPMLEWMLMPLKRYADFSGRSRRSEYWWFTLFVTVVAIVLVALMMAGGFSTAAMMEASAPGSSVNPAGLGIVFYIGVGLLVIFVLAILIPSIAVAVRRLHDRDMSGWWYLGVIIAGMIPFVGFIANIAFLVLMFLPGTPGPNRFGPDPKDPSNANVFA